MADNDHTSQGQSWTVEGIWRVKLSAILDGPYGQKEGDYVYAVIFCNIPIYVGKTTTSIRQRLIHHLGYGGAEISNLGLVLRSEHKNKYQGWSVEVMKVQGNLAEAEELFIRRLRPPLNKEFTRHTEEQVKVFINEFRKNSRARKTRKARKN